MCCVLCLYRDLALYSYKFAIYDIQVEDMVLRYCKRNAYQRTTGITGHSKRTDLHFTHFKHILHLTLFGCHFVIWIGVSL